MDLTEWLPSAPRLAVVADWLAAPAIAKNAGVGGIVERRWMQLHRSEGLVRVVGHPQPTYTSIRGRACDSKLSMSIASP